MREILQKGNAVLIYPEGTTHGDAKTINFKMGAFRLAADHQFSIIPMAIDYADPNDYWVTDITFVEHFMQQFSKWKTVVTIEYGEPIQGDDKEKLMRETKEWIDKKLSEF
jgi:1-acyl-sn-glycerol-3-phosphate acyltransferase